MVLPPSPITGPSPGDIIDIGEGVISAIGRLIASLGDRIISNIVPFVDGIFQSVGNLGGQIARGIERSVGVAIEAARFVSDRIQESALSVKNFVAGAVSEIDSVIRRQVNVIVEKVRDIAGGIINEIKGAAEGILRGVSDAFQFIADKLLAGLNIVAGAFITAIGFLAEKVEAGARLTANAFIGGIEALATGIKSTIEFGVNTVKTLVDTVVTVAETVIGPLLESIGKGLIDLPGEFVGLLGDAGKEGLGLVTGIFDGALSEVLDAVGFLQFELKGVEPMTIDVTEV